eukprot:2729646-Amphidinium_carterae.1
MLITMLADVKKKIKAMLVSPDGQSLSAPATPVEQGVREGFSVSTMSLGAVTIDACTRDEMQVLLEHLKPADVQCVTRRV